MGDTGGKKRRQKRESGGDLVGRGLGREEKGVNEEGIIIRNKMERENLENRSSNIKENLGRIMGRIKEEVEKRRGETGWIIGGDFNVRTGEKGALKDGGGEGRGKIKVVNRRGGGGIVKMGRGKRMGDNE